MRELECAANQHPTLSLRRAMFLSCTRRYSRMQNPLRAARFFLITNAQNPLCQHRFPGPARQMLSVLAKLRTDVSSGALFDRSSNFDDPLIHLLRQRRKRRTLLGCIRARVRQMASEIDSCTLSREASSFSHYFARFRLLLLLLDKVRQPLFLYHSAVRREWEPTRHCI